MRRWSHIADGCYRELLIQSKTASVVISVVSQTAIQIWSIHKATAQKPAGPERREAKSPALEGDPP
jgi:hypothetical protein